MSNLQRKATSHVMHMEYIKHGGLGEFPNPSALQRHVTRKHSSSNTFLLSNPVQDIHLKGPKESAYRSPEAPTSWRGLKEDDTDRMYAFCGDEWDAFRPGFLICVLMSKQVLCDCIPVLLATYSAKVTNVQYECKSSKNGATHGFRLLGLSWWHKTALKASSCPSRYSSWPKKSSQPTNKQMSHMSTTLRLKYLLATSDIILTVPRYLSTRF